MKDTIFLMEKGIWVGTCDVSGTWILNDVLKYRKKKRKKKKKYKNLKKFDPINLPFLTKKVAFLMCLNILAQKRVAVVVPPSNHYRNVSSHFSSQSSQLRIN